MDLAPDFDAFIGSLTAHGVEFIVVTPNRAKGYPARVRELRINS